MLVEVRSQGCMVPPALGEYVRRRLALMLASRRERIKRVDVRFRDGEGPPAGTVKACRIRIHLRDAPPAVAEDAAPDAYCAMEQAADRACRLVDRARRVRVMPLQPLQAT